MQEEYTLKLDLHYQNITKFKEKDAYILVSTITNSRLGIDHLKFASYGIISFADEDYHKEHPIVTITDKFNRLKVNCVVFDVLYNVQNDEYYDKLFIYSDATKDEYYNYVWYNSETHKMVHKFLLDKQVDILIQSITRDFHTMYNADIFEFYLNKNRIINDIRKNKSKNSAIVPGIAEWKKMIDKHNNKYLKYTTAQ